MLHFYKYLFICVHTCHGAYIEVRGQPAETDSLLLPCEFQGLNSEHQTWQQTPLSVKPTHQPGYLCFVFEWTPAGRRVGSGDKPVQASFEPWVGQTIELEHSNKCFPSRKGNWCNPRHVVSINWLSVRDWDPKLQGAQIGALPSFGGGDDGGKIYGAASVLLSVLEYWQRETVKLNSHREVRTLTVKKEWVDLL